MLASSSVDDSRSETIAGVSNSVTLLYCNVIELFDKC